MAGNPVTFVDLDGEQDTAYTRYLDRQFATVEGARQLHQANRAFGESVLNWGRNIVQGTKQQWKEGTTSDRIEVVATGVGTASGAVPYVGDYVSLISSTVVFGAKPSWSNVAGVGLDVLGAVLPFVPALGTVMRADKLADAAKEAEKLAEAAKDAEKVAEAGKDAEKAAKQARRSTLTPDDIAPGMKIDPTKTNVFRGGNSLQARPIDFKIDKATGLVQTTHGLSLDIRAAAVSRFGGAFRIDSLPEGLDIIQRGKALGHFEIVPTTPVTPERFQDLLNLIKISPEG